MVSRWKLIPLVALAATILLPAVARADDAEVASRLQALGGKVTQKDGVVTQVAFTDCARIGDAELQAIGQLSHLKSLTLYGKCAGLNDSTVGRLLTLQELETLNTEGAQLSDVGVRQLSGLASLRTTDFFHLSFGMEGFTGVGFAAWKKLPHLERLTVAGMSMGDPGFAAIAQLTQLRELRTWHTYQTEGGNAEIAKLPNLRRLQIGQRLPRPGAPDASLSDASIATLVKIPSLEVLQLGEAHFTLAGLRQLKTLPRLKQLRVYESDISPADIDTLRAELPAVKLDFEPLTDEQRKKFELYLRR